MYFTKKHEEWALFFGLRPSTRLIWSCIIRKTKDDRPQEIEIDLLTINKWIAKKRGKGYDRKTLKLAIAQLEERTEGLIVVLKKYSWHCYKLLVRPLSFLSEKKSQKGEAPTGENHGNPALSEEQQNRKVQQQQQNINRIDNLLRKVNLRFDGDALARIWQLSGKCINRVVECVDFMLYRNSSTAVERPHGYFMNALKYGLGMGFDSYYEPELPKFNSVAELGQYVANLKANLGVHTENSAVKSCSLTNSVSDTKSPSITKSVSDIKNSPLYRFFYPVGG